MKHIGRTFRDPDTDPHYGRNATTKKTDYYICQRCGFHVDKEKHPRRSSGDSYNYFTTSIDVFSPGLRSPELTDGRVSGSEYVREV